MPQESSTIATKPPSGEVFIFDVTNHDSSPKDKCSPDIRLIGHTKEG